MKRLPYPAPCEKTPEMKQFGAHFEATVAAAAAGDIQAKPIEFFVPTSPVLDARVAAMKRQMEYRVDTVRAKEVDAWVRRVMTEHLGAEICALPVEEFAEELAKRGVYGKEVHFPDDEPGVKRFVLYGRTDSGPHELIAAMTFEPTFGIDKA